MAWRVAGTSWGARSAAPAALECDVAIVGSGAGGGITAEIWPGRPEGGDDRGGPAQDQPRLPHARSRAYPAVPGSAARKTADKAINILQGRCVGGGTTVNWTSSLPHARADARHWREHFGLAEFDVDALAPWFAQVEGRLPSAPGDAAERQQRPAAPRRRQARHPAAAIRRNVKGCWNLGYCGMGCPTNAKQSMLVTTIPAALERGATLLVETRAERFDMPTARSASLLCVAGQGQRRRGGRRHRRAARSSRGTSCCRRRDQLAGAAAAIGAPDPHGRLGMRTFLHPVVISAGVMRAAVEGWQGAPQTDLFRSLPRHPPSTGRSASSSRRRRCIR